MEYRLVASSTATASSVAPPFTLRSSVELLEGSANVDLVFTPRLGSLKGHEGVLVEWYLGRDVTSSSWIPSGGGGTSNFDTRTGVRMSFASHFRGANVVLATPVADTLSSRWCHMYAKRHVQFIVGFFLYNMCSSALCCTGFQHLDQRHLYKYPFRKQIPIFHH